VSGDVSQTTLYDVFESPIGEFLLVGNERTLHGLYMDAGHRPADIRERLNQSPEHFSLAREQLGEYFAGERTEFDLAIEMHGTPFQLEVWSALIKIPYGQTTNYGELARRIGKPAAARAVGLANGRNPISVIVPCHRVIGAAGALTGYGGGIERKRMLLELEQGQATMPW
jgi:methylated-DNA-[protein]-cysteine S-methyltransferase